MSMMKEVFMKKFAYALLLMMMSITMIFSGCGTKGFKNNPSSTDLVIGNGGLVVQQGEYVYFANGKDSYNNASKDMIKGGLYRTKLNGQYFANLDENNYLVGAEKVSGKLVGYELGGMYLFDGYVYFATPNMEKDKEGNLLRTYIDFYRVKVNGTGETRLYTSDGSMEKGKWGMVKVDNALYLIVYNGDSLVSVQVSGKKPKVTTIARGVTDVVFAQNEEYNAVDYVTTDFERYVWYTRNKKEDESARGNILARCNLATNQEEALLNADTYKVVDLKNDRVYVNVTNSLGSTKLTSYAVSNFNDSHIFNVPNATSVYVFDHVGTELVIFENNTIFELYEYGNANPVTLDELDNASVIKTRLSSIYYVKSDVLYCLDVLDKVEKIICGEGEVKMPTDAKFYDFDGRNVYFMHTYKGEDGSENEYLTRYDMQKSSPVYEMFGSFAKGHQPVIEKEEQED